MKNIFHYSLTLFIALLVVGCGGGDGDSTDTSVDAEYAATEDLATFQIGEWKRLSHDGVEDLSDVIVIITATQMQWTNSLGCTWDSDWILTGNRYNWVATNFIDNTICPDLGVGTFDDGFMKITTDGSTMTLDSDYDDTWGTDVYEKQ
jgi:hypothetical protein